MRITNNMMVANTIRNINASANRLNEATERMSTELKIDLPSDDPVVATKTIKYRDYVAKVEQYQANASAASSWQKTTDDALSEIYDYIAGIKDDITQAASSGTLTTSEWADIKDEVGAYLKGIVQQMNADFGGRYIFGGYSVSEEPYKLLERIPTGVSTTQGSYDTGSIMIDDNELTSGQYTVNVSDNGDGTYAVTMKNSDGETVASGTAASQTATVALTDDTGGTVATLNAPPAGYAGGDGFSFTATEAVAVTYKGKFLSVVLDSSVDDETMQALYAGNTYVDGGANESIKYDLGYGADVTVNIEGQDVVGDSTSNLFNTITTLMLALSAADTTSGTSYKVYDDTTTSVTAVSGTSGYSASNLIADSGLESGTYSLSVAANGSNFDLTLKAANGKTYTATTTSTGTATFTIDGETVTLAAPAAGYQDGDALSFDVSGTVTTKTIDSISDLLGDINADIGRLATAQATLGARMTYVNNVSDRLANDYSNYSTLLSDTIDIDISKATIEQSSAETVYEAALAVGAKAISKTLVDYIA